jgi:hypothetical protein
VPECCDLPLSANGKTTWYQSRPRQILLWYAVLAGVWQGFFGWIPAIKTKRKMPIQNYLDLLIYYLVVWKTI